MYSDRHRAARAVRAGGASKGAGPAWAAEAETGSAADSSSAEPSWGALVARKENRDADHNEAEAGDPTNDLRTDVLGHQGAAQYAQCGSQNQRRRGRREDCPFWM